MRRKAGIRKVSPAQEKKHELDLLVRQYVLVRDGNCCRRCGRGPREGRGGALHCSHVMSKGAHPAMRWHLENVLLLCYRCHIVWWHTQATAEDRIAFCIKALGQPTYDRLLFTSRAVSSKVDHEMVKLYLLSRIGDQALRA